MSYRFIDANELIYEVDLKTQEIINNMDCVYVDGIKTCKQHFNLEEHDAEIRADERKRTLEFVASHDYMYIIVGRDRASRRRYWVNTMLKEMQKEQMQGE